MMYRATCLYLLLLTTLSLSAQTLGLLPPSAALRQIDTDTVRVIFQEGQEETAQRVANLVHAMAREFPIRGNDRLRKIPIILQNETDVPNAYVGLGPWRSEFYLSPPQNSFELGSLPWADLLAIHEWRHVEQRSAGKRGLSKIVRILLGEEAYSGILNLSWPNWYTEGDAVIAETVLTPQGRGRVPAFLNGYRAKLLEGEPWNYQKARNGSFRDFVPSHYPLGYLMQNYGREQYGQEFWDSVVLESAAYQSLVYPFSSAVEKRTNLSTVEMYHAAMDHYGERWRNIPMTMARSGRFSPTERRYRDYSYPVFDDDGGLYCVITGFDRIPGIYRRSSDKFEKLVSLGFARDERISYGGGKLCWAETRLDKRWARKDYTAVIIFDIATGKKRRLTGKSSYFSPALSSDGKRIVALYDDDSQQFTLRILSAEDGRVIESLPNPDNLYLGYPVWSDDGRHIVSAARDSSGKMALLSQEIGTGRRTVLCDWTFRPIGRPAVAGDWVYFAQSNAEAEHIFRINIRTGEKEQISDGPASHYQPVIDPVTGDLVFTEFSLWGNTLQRLTADSISAIESRSVISPSAPILEGETNLLANAPAKSYPTKKYALFSRPINIHSWNLFEEDPIYGIELLSENVLSSITWRNGFEYNFNDDSYGPFSQLSIGVWYPEILLGYTGRRRTQTVEDTDFRWFQHSINAGLRVPYQGYSGPYSQVGSVTSRVSRLTTTGDLDITFDFLTHRVSFINRRRRAVQHPMTRFGQAIDIRFAHDIGDTTNAEQFLIKTDFSFPSPHPNHVIWLQIDYRKELIANDFRFSDVFEYARGYNSVPADENYRIGVNYQFPVLYPDFGIAGIAYFKRLRANAFFDYSRVRVNNAGDIDLRSVGVEFIFDLEMFNVEPVEVGFRWSHLLDTDPREPGLRHKFGFFTPFPRL